LAKDTNEEVLATERKISLLGIALDLLMRTNGWTVTGLAKAAGVSPKTISSYLWEEALTRERFDELARLMGLSRVKVERAHRAAALVVPPPPAAWSPVEPTPEERRIHEEAAVLAGCEVMDLVLEARLREARQENRRRDLEEGRRLAKELLTFSKADRRVLAEAAPDYQHWGLAYVLCTDSEAAVPRNREMALELAELALFVARHVPGMDAFRSRLQGWCTGFVANVERGFDLPKAESTFARAWEQWRAGEDPAGLFSEAYLLDMEASLRRDQRLFPLALKRHEEALALARPEEIGVILLNQAFTRKETGDPEGAIRDLEAAAQIVDGERQPRLRCVLRFNEASSLLLLDRAEEAVPIITEVRDLAERLRNDIDLIKTLWLEGNCAAGLGQREEALSKLEQVRLAFQERALPFDYALASLDVALLYREESRFAEIAALSSQILGIFKAQRVNREALAAVGLFQEAAESQRVTVELIRRLQDYFSKAKCNPELRFGT